MTPRPMHARRPADGRLVARGRAAPPASTSLRNLVVRVAHAARTSVATCAGRGVGGDDVVDRSIGRSLDHALERPRRSTSAICGQRIRPSRKASTATSLAALSQAGAVAADPAGLVGQAEAAEGRRGRAARSRAGRASPSRCAPNGVPSRSG